MPLARRLAVYCLLATAGCRTPSDLQASTDGGTISNPSAPVDSTSSNPSATDGSTGTTESEGTNNPTGTGGDGNSTEGSSSTGGEGSSSTGGDGSSTGDEGPPSLVEGEHEVLFVGNSYTSTNDVSGRYGALAGADRVERVAPGGYLLKQHAADANTDGTALAKWLRTGTEDERDFDAVVLQEQSQVGGFAEGSPERIASLDAASELAALARANGSAIVLYLTWGREAGDPMNPGSFGTFSDMQDALDAGYRAMAARLRDEGATVRIAPVGAAFRAVHDDLVDAAIDPLTEGSDFDALYRPDGSHPSQRGAYLAACVFVGTITMVDPRSLPDDPALDPETSRALRDVAARVLEDEAWADELQ